MGDRELKLGDIEVFEREKVREGNEMSGWICNMWEGGREGMFNHGRIRTFVACLSSFKNANKVNALAMTQPTMGLCFLGVLGVAFFLMAPFLHTLLVHDTPCLHCFGLYVLGSLLRHVKSAHPLISLISQINQVVLSL